MNAAQLAEGIGPAAARTLRDAWLRWAAHPQHVELVSFPSRYLHPSWRSVLCEQSVTERIWSTDSAHPHLSRYLHRMLKLSAFQTPDLTHPAWDVALLPGDKLLDLVRHVGAVAAGTEIRGVIGRQAIRQVIEQVGRELYDFSVERAGLICENVPAEVLPKNSAGEFVAVATHLHHAGCRLVRQFLDTADSALWARARLKLAYETSGPSLESASLVADALASRIVLGTRRELQ